MGLAKATEVHCCATPSPTSVDTAPWLPCRGSQARAPCPSPHCTPSGSEPGPTTVWPTIQHPLSPSRRPHLNSLCIACTTPECRPKLISMYKRDTGGTRGSPSNLGKPSEFPAHLRQVDTLTAKTSCGKRGRKATPHQEPNYAFHPVQKTFLPVMPQGQHMQLLALPRLGSLKTPIPMGGPPLPVSLAHTRVLYHHPG